MGEMKSRSRRGAGGAPALPLFDFSAPAAPARAHCANATSSDRSARRATRDPADDIVTVCDSHLPSYSSEMVTAVAQEVASIPTDRVLLTYKEIWDYFGVSRATVVRRMRDGLIPGIRLQHGRVLDDGPIRRLSRAQVRWLLLAVRRGWRT